MKNKLVLSLAAVGLTFAVANSAKAGFSLDVSIGSRYPSHGPVVVAPQPPVVYTPAPVDQCAPPVVVAPPPQQVIVTRPVYHDDYYRNDRRYDWRRNHRPDYRDDRQVIYRRADDHRRW
jgi:hypothetical protein